MQFRQLLGQVIGRENERKALVNLRIGREPLPPGNSVNFKLWWLMIKNPLNSRNQIIQQKRPEQKFHHRHHHLPVRVCSSAELGAIQTSLPNTRRLRRGLLLRRGGAARVHLHPRTHSFFPSVDQPPTQTPLPARLAPPTVPPPAVLPQYFIT